MSFWRWQTGMPKKKAAEPQGKREIQTLAV
jgi:hypothetical protein